MSYERTRPSTFGSTVDRWFGRLAASSQVDSVDKRIETRELINRVMN